jgi:hypothetical protein
MPSVSKKQHNFMAAIANNPKFAKKVGVPQSVGKEFVKEDEGKKFRGGGLSSEKQAINKPRTHHGKMQLPNYSLQRYIGKKEGGEMKESKGMKKGGYAAGGRMASKGEHSVQKQSKRGAMMVKMAAGGLAAGHKTADGIAKKGKTKAKHVAMKKGGYC